MSNGNPETPSSSIGDSVSARRDSALGEADASSANPPLSPSAVDARLESNPRLDNDESPLVHPPLPSDSVVTSPPPPQQPLDDPDEEEDDVWQDASSDISVGEGASLREEAFQGEASNLSGAAQREGDDADDTSRGDDEDAADPDFEPEDGGLNDHGEDDIDDDDDEDDDAESDMDLGEDDDDDDDDIDDEVVNDEGFQARRRQLFDELRTPRHRNDIMRRMLNAMMTAMMGRSSAEIEDEEEDEGSAPRENPEVRYDVELPGTHSYLGNDLEDHSGRTVLEEETLHTIPLHTHTGVVLMPGEVLPLHIHHPHTISMMNSIMETHRTFGVIHQDMLLRRELGVRKEGNIGVTAEIFSSKEEGDDFRMMSLKAMGRQRFEIVETRREATGVQIAKVRMLPEVWFSSPLDGGGSGSGSFAVDTDDSATEEQMNKFLGLSPRKDSSHSADVKREAMKRKLDLQVDDTGTSHHQGGDQNAFRKRLRRRRGGHSLSADMTVWPSWVYKQYEVHDVMTEIKKELRCWDSSNKMNLTPQDPVQFSFWVAGNLPVDDSLRLHLLSIKCANQRLRAELAILKKCTKLQCRKCGTDITDTSELFSMSKTGPQSAYVNPSGFVFETLTVYKAKNILFFGSPNPEYSWFPGYAWTSGSCRNCHHQMGWKFTVTKEKEGQLVPSKFFGITRRSIKPALDDSSFELEEETKKEREEREKREEERAKREEQTRGREAGLAEEAEELAEEERREKKREKRQQTWLPIL